MNIALHSEAFECKIKIKIKNRYRYHVEINTDI